MWVEPYPDESLSVGDEPAAPDARYDQRESVELASGKFRWRVVPTRANGQPAFGHYIWDDEADAFVAHGIAVLTLDGARIGEIPTLLNPEVLTRFGLPATAPGGRAARGQA